MTKCPSTGLDQYASERKARLGCKKLRFQSRGVDKFAPDSEPCGACGYWHVRRLGRAT